MAEQIQFDLVSPEQLLLSQAVDGVVVPGTEGEMTILPRHAPLMSTLRAGVIQVLGANIKTPRYFVFGGFAEVTPAGLVILAEEAVPLDQIEVSVLDQRIRDLEEDVADARDDEARLAAADKLGHLRQVRTVL